jgi:hypothetical protein
MNIIVAFVDFSHGYDTIKRHSFTYNLNIVLMCVCPGKYLKFVSVLDFQLHAIP